MYAPLVDGHSGGVTPGPIPNPEVKPTHVPRCTMVREPMGTGVHCPPPLLFSYKYIRSIFLLFAMPGSILPFFCIIQ